MKEKQRVHIHFCCQLVDWCLNLVIKNAFHSHNAKQMLTPRSTPEWAFAWMTGQELIFWQLDFSQDTQYPLMYTYTPGVLLYCFPFFFSSLFSHLVWRSPVFFLPHEKTDNVSGRLTHWLIGAEGPPQDIPVDSNPSGRAYCVGSSQQLETLLCLGLLNSWLPD